LHLLLLAAAVLIAVAELGRAQREDSASDSCPAAQRLRESPGAR
jgi:hypothetical protein